MTAPFGSVLKEVPGNLYEVLQFRDEAHSEPPSGDTECYGAAAAPRFMASMPDEYLLCFAHDRLSRIEATVRLDAGRASDLFAGACALWGKSAHAGAAAPLDGACQGTDGAVHYRATLEAAPEESDVLLTMKLEPGDLSGNQTGDKPSAQPGNQD